MYVTTDFTSGFQKDRWAVVFETHLLKVDDSWSTLSSILRMK